MAGEVSSDLRLREQFTRLSELKEDWDGQGAQAPASETLDAAERFLVKLADQHWPIPARVYSLPTGEVVAEWDQAAAHFEIEIAGTGSVSWMSSGPNKQSVHGTNWDSEAVHELASTLAPEIIPPKGQGLEFRVLQAFIGDCIRRELSAINSGTGNVAS